MQIIRPCNFIDGIKRTIVRNMKNKKVPPKQRDVMNPPGPKFGHFGSDERVVLFIFGRLFREYRDKIKMDQREEGMMGVQY